MRKLFPIVCVLIALAMSSCGPEPPPIIIPGDGGSGVNDTTLIRISELPAPIIPEDNPLTVAGVDLGRHLFYDKILSGDQTQACASCHHQNKAFSDGLRVSAGIHGDSGTRNAMVTFNLMWSAANFWDSRAANLRELATMPIENPVEMDARVPDVLIRLNASTLYKDKFKKAFGTDTIKEEHLAKAIEQFLLTITSDNSKFDKVNRGEMKFTEQEQRGFETLKNKGCFNCHSTSLMHDNISHNTGMDIVPKDKGLGDFTKNLTDDFKFRTPSLRNIMLTAPYMHDGRFNSIEDVIHFYESKVQFSSRNLDVQLMQIAPRNKLSTQELQDVKAFLNTLTDQTLITDKRFSDPF